MSTDHNRGNHREATMSGNDDGTSAQRASLESPDGRSFTLKGEGPRLRVGDHVRIQLGEAELLGFVEGVETGRDGESRAHGSVLSGSQAHGAAAWNAMVTVSEADATDIADVLSGDDEGLHVGTLVARPGVKVGLVAKRLNRHTFWCGQSGSGKTYALGVALERIVSATHLPIVVFDPNSDFTRIGTARADANPDEAATLDERDIRVLRPDDADSPLRIRFTSLSMPGKAAVLRLDPVVHRAEYNTLVRLGPDFEGEDAAHVVPHLRALGGPDAEALAQRIENLGVADWTGIWAQGATAATDVIAGRPDVTVLDLGGYERNEQQLVVALAVLEDLWRRRTERRPVLLVVDEAHNLCPPDPETPLGRAVRDRLIQIAAEGRKFGLWLLVSTQRPGKVHHGVVSQCDNLTLMRMNSRADLAELGELFGFVPDDMLRRSSHFAQGEALMAGGFVPLPSIVRIRPRVTVEGGIDVPVPLRH